jgi:hypothetical protein
VKAAKYRRKNVAGERYRQNQIKPPDRANTFFLAFLILFAFRFRVYQWQRICSCSREVQFNKLCKMNNSLGPLTSSLGQAR